MPFYQSPGVYVEEPDKGARPIQPAGTSVLALVGLVRETVNVLEPGAKAPVAKRPPDTPTLVTNWSQFTQIYGDTDQAYPGGYLHDAMYGYFLNGGSTCFVVGIPAPVVEEGVKPEVPLLPAGEGLLKAPDGNAVVKVTTTGPYDPAAPITVEIQPPAEGAPPDSFNVVIRHGTAEPKTITNVGTSRGKGVRSIVDVLPRETDNLLAAQILGTPAPLAIGQSTSLAQAAAPAAKPESTPTPLKGKVTAAMFKGNINDRTGIAGLEAVEEVTMVACPDILAAYKAGAVTEEDVKAVQTFILNHCELMRDRCAILDCPAGLSPQETIAWRKEKMNFDSKYGALYYPWIRINGKLAPPSGHVAGVYARVDGERGVHKAPANEIVRGAVGLERVITRGEQDLLNPIGVNCIRTFPGQGIRIWGARTLSSDPLWRYINVRRLFCMVEESIQQNTNWIVFEPNDDILWRQIRRDVTAFLTVIWRSGALFGTTPEQAFYVKCDEETNPKEMRDLGYCITEIGMAPVKPAEFVVFRVSQKAD